jgi:hypothetical protein
LAAEIVEVRHTKLIHGFFVFNYEVVHAEESALESNQPVK